MPLCRRFRVSLRNTAPLHEQQHLDTFPLFSFPFTHPSKQPSFHIAIMLLSSLLSVSVLGVAAQAFMVPEIAELPDTHNSNNVVPAIIDHNNQVIKLDCSNCLYAVKSDDRNRVHEWTADVASDLEMKFEADGKVLKFNGVPFYPTTNPTMPPLLSVSQNKKDGEVSTMEGYHGTLRMSYSVEYSTKKFTGHTLVTLLMTVMGIDGQMVKVDNIEIKVVRSDDDTVSPQPLPLFPVRS